MSEKSTDDDERRTGDEHRRSFLKKGAIASGALALGGGAIGSAAAQDETPTGTPTGQGGSLVFSYDYYPGTTFVVEGQLNARTTRDMLDGVQDQGIDEIPNPSSWDGYVIRYRFASQGGTAGGPGQGGIFAFLFSQQSLQRDQSYQFMGQASVLAPELNLLEVAVQSAGGGGTPTPSQ